MAATPGHADDRTMRREASGSIERAGVVYGATVAKLLVLLDQAETALVCVTIGNREISIIAVDPKALRTGISAYRMTDVIPCTYDMNTRRLVIGSTAAIKQAGRAP